MTDLGVAVLFIPILVGIFSFLVYCFVDDLRHPNSDFIPTFCRKCWHSECYWVPKGKTPYPHYSHFVGMKCPKCGLEGGVEVDKFRL